MSPSYLWLAFFHVFFHRHVSSTDKTGKRYRNVNLDIFSIEDDDGKILGFLLCFHRFV